MNRMIARGGKFVWHPGILSKSDVISAECYWPIAQPMFTCHHVTYTLFTRALETHICDDWRRGSDAKDACDFIAHFHTIQRGPVTNVPCYAVFAFVGQRLYMYRWYCDILWTVELYGTSDFPAICICTRAWLNYFILLHSTMAEKRGKKTTWTFEETNDLINEMAKAHVQKRLEGMVHNHKIWKEIACARTLVHEFCDEDTLFSCWRLP